MKNLDRTCGVDWPSESLPAGPINTLLERLNGVRRTGAGRWIARCPAHEDRHASLGARELEDGRVLLHCFAGCATEQVLAALGLSFADLYPPRPVGDPVGPLRRPFPAADVLRALAHETLVIYLIARALVQGQIPSESERERLELAVARLQRGLEVACRD